MNAFTQKIFFILRYRFIGKISLLLRLLFLNIAGAQIGKGVSVSSVYINWPHQLFLGNNCILEHGVHFKYDGIWKPGPSIILHDEVFIGAGCEFNINHGIEIGKEAMIASGCKFIDHDHGTALNERMNTQQPVSAPIRIGEGVWLGVNCVVLKGVSIGRGAIIAAGSVVNKSVGEFEVYAGVPARLIKKRS